MWKGESGSVVMRRLGVGYLTISGVCLAFCTFHLDYGMLYSELQELVLDLLSDGVGFADPLVADLHVGRKGRYPVSYRPDMDIVHADNSGYSGNKRGQFLSVKAD